MAIYQRIIEWFSTNFKFVAVNGLSHLLMGMLIGTILYPFLSSNYQRRLNYTLFVFFPAVLGSIFPDLLFAISTLVKSGGSLSWGYLLQHGGAIHSVFHRDIALALVVPTTVFLVIVFVYLINFIRYVISWGKTYNKIKLDELPKGWLLISSGLSLVGAVLHLLMDMMGF